MTIDKRKSTRIPFQAKVSIAHGDMEPHTVGVRDISDGGIFIVVDGGIDLFIGLVLNVQMQGMPVEAPIREMQVVRLEHSGAGLKFVECFD